MQTALFVYQPLGKKKQEKFSAMHLMVCKKPAMVNVALIVNSVTKTALKQKIVFTIVLTAVIIIKFYGKHFFI